jgi:hypothetical protein
MFDYETMTAEQYETYFYEQYGSEDDHLIATDTDTDNN